jgi:hypothetical protein
MSKVVALILDLAPLILSIVFLGIAYFKNKNLMRIDKPFVKKVLVYIFIAKLISIGFTDLMVTLGYVDKYSLLNATKSPMPFFWFFMVFWEDGFYGLTIYYLKEVNKTLPEIVKTILISGICFKFMLGHLYQGSIGMMAIIYPFYLSYTYGKRHGFGSVMVLHILFDLISFMMYNFYVKVIL